MNIKQTVDVLVIVEDTHVLLIRRAKPPFQDRLVMPGGHVESGEDLRAAAVRELEEEVGLIAQAESLTEDRVLDAPGRDPRPGHRVSTVFRWRIPWVIAARACAASDAKEVIIRPIASLTKDDIGFDHWQVIEGVCHESTIPS